ncbi:MAG: hypothetical protein CHACPFDD_01866 [Phycisphaerae bacterium]|nr:hypothetical protein [Phycisphaerae bacterium]
MKRSEIVHRAITFDNPPRVPFKFDVVGVNDCYDVWTVDPTGWTWNFEGERADEFGCVWRRSQVQNTGLVVGHPLRDLAALRDYHWPDPDDPRRYAGFAQQLAGADDRFVMFCFGHGIWERLHMLHGMTESLVDFYKRPREMHELIERILDHHIRVLRNCVRIAADGVSDKWQVQVAGDKWQVTGGRCQEKDESPMKRPSTPDAPPVSPVTGYLSRTPRIHAAAMADDWGLQDRAFVNLKIFREFFKPRYQAWFNEIKSLGLHTWMHSCGRINDILEELIDVGLEVINPQQPNTVGIDEISRRFRGRVCFESIVDTQSTLPRGTHDEIRQQAHELLDKWGTPRGGYIVSDYNDAEAIGVTLDRRLVMFEAYAEKAGYPDYRTLVERARAANGLAGHSFGRHTQAAATAGA